MASKPYEYVGDEDTIKSGLGCLLLAVVKGNFVLLKYLLSEELHSLWNHDQLRDLLDSILKLEHPQTGLVCLISSPAFSHYYETQNLKERKELKDFILK
jgi:hypothetical protein